MHPVGLDLPLAESGADDSGDESDLDVRLSERIRSTARAQAAHTSAGYASVGAAHLEAQYASEDEDPDSVARRKRRLGQSYISSESRRRTEAIWERRLRLAEMMAAEEDACVAAAAADEDEMDVDGPGRRSGGAGGEPHPPRKRRFFRESRLDLAALLKPPARTSPASGPIGYGMMDPRRAGPAGGAAGYAASDLASMSHVGAGALSNGGNGITREWQDGLPA